jgi:hypothetical protein
MALSKQITACQITIYQADGSTPASGYPKRVELYSGSVTVKPYFYSGTSFDEALSGKLRTQLGGFRPTVQLGWERLLNTANLANIVKDAVTTSFRPRIFFAPNASEISNGFNVILTDVTWSASIQSQITTQPINVEFQGQEVLPNIPGYLQQ